MWVRVSKASWCEGTSIFKVLSRVWIPLVILAVVCVAAFAVTRIHGLFGSEKRPSYSDGQVDETKPFNPKRLTYEIFGPPGTVADISYFDVNSEPQRVQDVTLPWQLEIVTTLPAVVGSIMAQGNSNSIGCRIIVDGEVKAERISNEVNAYTFCLLKAA
ncbi:membrane protein [Mycolicibacter heraklionensis]|uniref:Membrane protein n=1 Tax=Mycolicibacter heraklionensis TaxID=512402 RepID=A0A9X7WMJ0_9MYCO|nr:MmpS family protein [Mycolicibacter heraklionensis]KLO28026.1 membrane protein [Mycolicibacter heraklionensis]QZA10299.1 MmpS family protein [Mycolicibacter heraklionensis]